MSQTSEPVRREKLMLWLSIVVKDPLMVSHGVVERPDRPSRRVYLADVPGANTRVSFLIVELPARCVHILDIDDNTFGAPIGGE